jgi:hypothetical protein
MRTPRESDRDVEPSQDFLFAGPGDQGEINDAQNRWW